jgi:hypothetical protein
MPSSSPASSSASTPWIQGYDTTYSRFYYFNTVTEESSWEAPKEGYREFDPDASSSSDESDSDSDVSSAASPEKQASVASSGASPDLTSPVKTVGSPAKSPGKAGRFKGGSSAPPSPAHPPHKTAAAAATPPAAASPAKPVPGVPQTNPGDGEDDDSEDEDAMAAKWEKAMAFMATPAPQQATPSQRMLEQQPSTGAITTRFADDDSFADANDGDGVASPAASPTRQKPKQISFTTAAGSPSKGRAPLQRNESGIPSLRLKKQHTKSAAGTIAKPWGAGPFRKPTDAPPKKKPSRHEREAAQLARTFESHIAGDFIERQQLDVANRTKLAKNLLKKEVDAQKRKQKEATHLNRTSTKILKATGRNKLSRDDWFRSLHNSRVNHMTQFLLAKGSEMRDEANHNPTMFTDPRERRISETPRNRANSTRSRMSDVSGSLDPRRFDSFVSDADLQAAAIERDGLLSPRSAHKKKAGSTEVFFKPEHTHRNAADLTNVAVMITCDENNEEEVMFMEAFRRNLREESESSAEERAQTQRASEKNRRSSAIGVSMGSGGDLMAHTFKSPAAADKFVSENNTPGKGGGNDAVLALTPSKNRTGRRATTSHLLVTSICRHITDAVREITDEDYVTSQGFETLLERMAFLGGDANENYREEDGRLLQNLWETFSEDHMVSLSACQRLLLQVLAGLEVNNSLSPTNVAAPSAKEKKYVSQLSELYNTRRLLQKPRHHRDLAQKNGLLHTKVNKHDTPPTGLTATTKKKLRRESVGGTPISVAMMAATNALQTKTRRRASTFTSRLRIKRTVTSKKDLEDHYKCTFKPHINKLSRKLDARQYRNNLAAQKLALLSPTPKKRGAVDGGTPSASIMQLKKDAYEDAVHILAAAIQHDQQAVVSMDDISHAFDDLLSDPDHNKEAELAQTLLAECFSQFPKSETNPPLASSLLDVLISEKNPTDRMENDDLDDESYAAVQVPPTLAARLQKWRLWQLKRDKLLDKAVQKKISDEIRECTFAPALNDRTLKIVRRQVEKEKRAKQEEHNALGLSGTQKRLYEEGARVRYELDRKHTYRKYVEKGFAEQELEECYSNPKIAPRIPPGDVDIMDFNGAKTWFKKVDDARFKKMRDKEAEDKKRLRKTGEHLYTSKYDATTKYCKPYKFNRGKDERKFRSTRKFMEEKVQQDEEKKEERGELRRKASAVSMIAKKEDFLTKQLNRHSGPPLLVVEVTTSKGKNERLCIWEDDDYESVAREYGKVNGLSAMGVTDLVAVLKENVEAVLKEREEEEEEEEEWKIEDVVESSDSSGEDDEVEEYYQRLEEIYNELDRNLDGRVTPREIIMAVRDNPDLAAELGLPREIDDRVAREVLVRYFGHMDTDHDKSVSKEEFVAFYRMLGEDGEEEEEQEQEEPAGRVSPEIVEDVNAEFRRSSVIDDPDLSLPLDITQL